MEAEFNNNQINLRVPSLRYKKTEINDSDFNDKESSYIGEWYKFIENSLRCFSTNIPTVL